MADKDGMERKVYLLPEDLVERIKAYQSDVGLPSEVEAARKLLSEALQARDSLDDVMRQAALYFMKDKDLRSLARDVLTRHILVTRVDIDDHEVRFVLRNLDVGKIDRKGNMEIGTSDNEGWIRFNGKWTMPESKLPLTKTSMRDDKTSGLDLDDEIPF